MRHALTALAAAIPLLAQPLSAETISIVCGPSQGYSYYFKGGLVGDDRAGFSNDGISNGRFTLVANGDESGLTGDVLSLDAADRVTSASSQGGSVVVTVVGNGMNWLTYYPDGTLENYAFNFSSSTTASWRNTVGNENIAKNSLFVSDCAVE